MNISIDSKIYKLTEWVYRILKLNFLVILGSLGIVTVGASVSAAAYICRKWFEGKEVSIFSEFKKNYKENIKTTVTPSFSWILISFVLLQGQHITNLSKIYFVFHLYANLLFFLFFYIKSNYHISLPENILFSFKALNLNIWVLIPFYGISIIVKFLILKQLVIFITLGIGIMIVLINILVYVVLKKY